MENGDNLGGNVSSDRHTPSHDTNSINRVIERAKQRRQFYQ
jgi:hypothetical protein